jgi:hypothetical protein
MKFSDVSWVQIDQIIFNRILEIGELQMDRSEKVQRIEELLWIKEQVRLSAGICLKTEESANA